MKKIINDSDYLKNLLPSLEKKIETELSKIIEEECRKRGTLTALEKEEISSSIKSEFLASLGVSSFESFFEKEKEKVLSLFEKNFPYKSIDDFIENAFTLTGNIKSNEIE